jgi:hypothetical protein
MLFPSDIRLEHRSAILLLFVIDLWSIYAELLIPCQVVVLWNTLSTFFLIYRRQVNVAVVATV